VADESSGTGAPDGGVPEGGAHGGGAHESRAHEGGVHEGGARGATAAPHAESAKERRRLGRDAEPVDPDTAVDPLPPRRGRTPRREKADVIAAIAAGGAIGACARYGATLLWPAVPGAFPWTTFGINISGCAAMGVLMVLVTERFRAHALIRPFLGTGVLGGYTTFSTYALDSQRLLNGGHGGLTLVYLAATVLGALLAVWGAASLTRLVAPPRIPAAAGPPPAARNGGGDGSGGEASGR
jgi:fluoride exporter